MIQLLLRPLGWLQSGGHTIALSIFSNFYTRYASAHLEQGAVPRVVPVPLVQAALHLERVLDPLDLRQTAQGWSEL
jgi:hypothetical protein